MKINFKLLYFIQQVISRVGDFAVPRILFFADAGTEHSYVLLSYISFFYWNYSLKFVKLSRFFLIFPILFNHRFLFSRIGCQPIMKYPVLQYFNLNYHSFIVSSLCDIYWHITLLIYFISFVWFLPERSACHICWTQAWGYASSAGQGKGDAGDWLAVSEGKICDIRGHPYISWRQIWQFSPPPPADSQLTIWSDPPPADTMMTWHLGSDLPFSKNWNTSFQKKSHFLWKTH